MLVMVENRSADRVLEPKRATFRPDGGRGGLFFPPRVLGLRTEIWAGAGTGFIIPLRVSIGTPKLSSICMND